MPLRIQDLPTPKTPMELTAWRNFKSIKDNLSGIVAGTINNVAIFTRADAVGDAPGFYYATDDGGVYTFDAFVVFLQEISGTSLLLSNLVGTGTRLVGSTSAGVLGNPSTFAGDYIFLGSFDIAGAVNVGGNIILAQTTSAIISNTADGSDTKRTIINGGGGTGTTRGGQILFYGNEFASDGGSLALEAGNVATGKILLSTGGSVRAEISAAGAATFYGATALSGGISSVASLSGGFYEEGSFTAGLTGVSGSPTGTAYWVKVGKSVTLFLPSLTGTSISTSCTVTGLPAAIFPTRGQRCGVVIVMDNGTEYEGHVTISTSGVIFLSFRTDPTTYSSTFTSSGSKGLNGVSTISYGLN